MNSRIAVYFILIFSLGITTSCDNEEDTIAEILVVNQEGTSVQGAEVRIFGQGTVDSDQVGDIAIDRTTFTNTNGIAEFDFTDDYEPGQSGFAILDVEILFDSPTGISAASGVLKVVEEETTRKTFVLEP
ncbi:MAG: hypothetical protein MK086_03135 [Flavobacteriales bacterium]|nr:hypothetical protein [Flavobacteriales bacterium]